jgi:hypothetical protein
MDPVDILQVRFHLRGQFDYDGFAMNYVGGSVGMSYIERDKLSLPELRGHLSDHTTISVEDHVDFYWLYPGEEISNGLRKLGDDQTCLDMSQCTSDSGVAEVFIVMYKPRETVDDQVQSTACSRGTNNQTTKTSQEEEKDESESEGDEEYMQGEEDTSESDEDYSICDEDAS